MKQIQQGCAIVLLHLLYCNPNRRRNGDRRVEYIAPVGWQHYSRNSYREVASAKGGDTRTVTRKAGEGITGEVISEQEKTFFFKDGNSYFGKLEAMSVCIIDPSGETISEFTDTNGSPCS